MSQKKQKLLKLIQSGDKAKIKLAFKTAKSDKLELDLSNYNEIFEWLLQYKKMAVYQM